MTLWNSLQKLTDISWIGALKEGGEEEICYIKTFDLERLPDFAGIRLNSKGVCAIYLNGQFIESSCGRYQNRITYAECTSALKQGENTLALRYAGHYFQACGVAAQARRGGWFSAVAAQLELRREEQTQWISTDESWQAEWCGKTEAPTVFSQVTEAEYDRFWRADALYEEPKERTFSNTVLEVAGADYAAYRRAPQRKDAYPEAILQEGNDKIYDFGRLHVGYLSFEYKSEKEGELIASFDYNEDPADLTVGATDDFSRGVIESLAIRIPLNHNYRPCR